MGCAARGRDYRGGLPGVLAGQYLRGRRQADAHNQEGHGQCQNVGFAANHGAVRQLGLCGEGLFARHRI